VKDTATNGALKLGTPSDREISLTRDFDAPRGLVFDALTKPELVREWMGPRGWSLVVSEIDLRVGGRYRFVGRRADGPEMGWGGVYREIARPERLVHTEVFDEPWYPGEALVTTVLTERRGRTTLAATVLYESREARDAVLRTPMERGVTESYDRLGALLATTAASAR
jgi:uncharacterized protein YndB with AHSA1/START domain